ncbi:putative integral membrane protein [Dichotomopilus funicola]|uniref:Integral membrane protein n=1 Tax=Dichotomopilus funicola TaxID=1934379 RepID=A0AAN6ZP03_9PEZI|nr:putative integral membrane protein [Dichotomopilus funicola]
MAVVYLALATNPTGVTMLSVLWSLLTLSAAFVGLRIYSKLKRNRMLWWDDYVIICSWIFLLISCSCTTYNTRLGFGRPAAQVPFDNYLRTGITSNLSGSTSVAAVAWSKTSFGLTLLRLVNDRRILRALLIGMLIVVIVTHHCSVMFFWFSCDPPEKTWDPRVEGTCWSPSKFVTYSICVAACSAVCDFTLALVPWVVLLRFNMYNGEKIGVAIAMSMGVFTGIACIIKITTFSVFFSDDFSRDCLGLIVWSFMEPSVTIMAASIPFMRHLFKSLSRSTCGQSHDLENDGSNNNSNSTTTNTNTTNRTTNTAANKEEAEKEDRKAEMRRHWGQLYGGLQGPSGEK